MIKQFKDKVWNINFNAGMVRVSGLQVEGKYLVKWFCDDEFRGEHYLGQGNWGAFNLELGIWKLEFWKDDNLEDTYIENWENKNILIVANFNEVEIGKNLPIDMLIKRGNEIKLEYKCNVVFYFKNSEKYNMSPLHTLKMNDELDFELILEETYG